MKKVVKSSLLFAIIAMILITLTGCGGNKLVATKSTGSEDSMFGAYEEKIEITFKNDKADKIVWTMEFKDETTAKSMSGLYQMASSELKDLEVKQDGKKVVLKMSAESFAKDDDLKDEDLTKDALTKKLKEQGYTIK